MRIERAFTPMGYAAMAIIAGFFMPWFMGQSAHELIGFITRVAGIAGAFTGKSSGGEAKIAYILYLIPLIGISTLRMLVIDDPSKQSRVRVHAFAASVFEALLVFAAIGFVMRDGSDAAFRAVLDSADIGFFLTCGGIALLFLSSILPGTNTVKGIAPSASAPSSPVSTAPTGEAQPSQAQQVIVNGLHSGIAAAQKSIVQLGEMKIAGAGQSLTAQQILQNVGPALQAELGKAGLIAFAVGAVAGLKFESHPVLAMIGCGMASAYLGYRHSVKLAQVPVVSPAPIIIPELKAGVPPVPGKGKVSDTDRTIVVAQPVPDFVKE